MVKKAFIVKEEWGRLILDRKKTWEIRGTGTNMDGRVGVIFSGTGKIYGSVDIIGSGTFDEWEFAHCWEKHRLPGEYKDLPYKDPHSWILGNAIWYREPVPYEHPRGAVIWVDLEKQGIKLL
ncbi:MAG: ASCH domain-containing protein [Ruminococcus flavefaciens]|nr:ASCH domain-containing protein [Ruminococcus flavefaciens]